MVMKREVVREVSGLEWADGGRPSLDSWLGWLQELKGE